MKTKNKILALLEITIVLCSVFLVALPAIAAEQNQEMQKASENMITTASEDDYVLDIYGNANEDDTIDMRDLTYVKLIFFGKKPETELADAKYDGKINPLDFIQIKLIIVGKEKELTVIDGADRIVTVKKPVERIVALNIDCAGAIRALGAKDKIVGIDEYIVASNVEFPEISQLPTVGNWWIPDVEAILSLEPDMVFAYTATLTSPRYLEEVLPESIKVIRLEFYMPDIRTEDMEKLGYILGKKEEADEYVSFYNEHVNIIEDRVAELSDEEKPRVYLTSVFSDYNTVTDDASGHAYHQVCEIAGGINIFADLGGGGYVDIDPEALIVSNPDIFIRYCYGITGYGVGDPSEAIVLRDSILNREVLAEVPAVKNSRVYILGYRFAVEGSTAGIAYMAKWFHPNLFTDLDPQAIHQEYIDRFCPGLDYDVYEQGVFAYPKEPVS